MMNKRVYILPEMPNNYMDLLIDCFPEDVTVHTDTNRQPFTLFLNDIVRHRPNTIHVHWPHPYYLFWGAVPTRFLSTLATAAAAGVFLLQIAIASFLVDSVVWTVHNKHNHARRQHGVEHETQRLLARLADTITVWDDTTRNAVINDFGASPEKVTILPHPNYKPLYNDLDVSQQLPVSDVATEYNRVLLYFGRIRPYKNICSLVETYETVTDGDTLLIVAGNPDDDIRFEIQACLERSDDVVGDLRYIPDEEVPLYFETADLAVFPYDAIFNSGSIILAMTFGTPFIAPNKGAIPSLSPEGNVIYDDLKTGLQDGLSRSDEDLKRTGALNREVAEKEHSQQVVWEAIQNIYGWTNTT